MVAAFKKFISNYFNFKDRTTRADYWWVILDMCILGFVLGFILGLIGSSQEVMNIVLLVIELLLIIPSLSLSVRRLHDINKSGWFLLLGLIPVVGSIILIVFYCTPSINENNKYGAVE